MIQMSYSSDSYLRTPEETGHVGNIVGILFLPSTDGGNDDSKKQTIQNKKTILFLCFIYL